MNNLKYVYKSIGYSRRGESLIQAPPESLHANTFFSVADLKIVYYYYIPTLLEVLRHESRPPRSSKNIFFYFVPPKISLMVA
jgi:hypothetical protein